METTFVLLLLLSPFVGFLSALFFSKNKGNLAGYIGTTAVFVSFVFTVLLFNQVNTTKNPIHIHLFEWMQLVDFKINFSFLLDQLSLLWLLFVTGIGTLIHLYSISYLHDDQNRHKYFSYLNLFLFFMILLVIGSNLLILFIGWEGVGLCSYLLIGFWHTNQNYNDAAKKAFIMNRIGDLGFLIGIFILGYVFNTLDFVELKQAVIAGNAYSQLEWVGLATLCLFIGATGKSAQLPLFTWLPDAMAGPTPVSALIHAATMVTAGIFMITRLDFMFDLTPAVQDLMAYVGAFTALLAATIACFQNDIKKVLAYSTVSQLGLMFLALGLGAYQVAVFHVITHAFFKACLFLGSGSVIHGMHGEQDIRNMGGLRHKMKTTHITFAISTLAISGIPPLAGFFSKDEILLVAFHENTLLWIIAAIASILTAYYMFRLLFLTFYGTFRGTEKQAKELCESDGFITFPLVVLAVLAAVGGAISIPGNSWLENYLKPVLSQATEAHHLDATTLTLMATAVVGALIGLGIAFFKFIKREEVPMTDDRIIGFTSLIYDKYKIDEIYDFIIVKPINLLGSFGKNVIEPNLSKMIFSVDAITDSLGNQGKKLHNGNLGFYLFAFVFGLCATVYYLFFIR